MLTHLGCPFTIMAATGRPFESLTRIATLTLVLGALCHLAVASYPTCQANFDWAFNTLNQSPCEVSAALGGVCIGGNFSLANLSPTQVYSGPSAGFDTPCRCNTVYYSTLSACAVCQGASSNRWTYYSTNCTTVYSQLFPSAIPSGIQVPHWAYLDVITADKFDPVLAKNAGGSDSTAPPQATATSSTSSSSSSSKAKNKTNVGAIAGGVVGGVVGLALIVGGIVFWLLRRKKPSSELTPGTYNQPFTSFEKPVISSMNTGNTGTAYVPISTPAPKPYNPNDPTTFPTNVPQNYTGTTNTFVPPSPALQQPLYPSQPNFTGTTQAPLGPSGRAQYTGAPEL